VKSLSLHSAWTATDPIYENVAEFNARTLAFLTRHSG
jgi:hypothetical protein